MPRTPNYDCEIWIGTIVGTPGPPGKGEKWIPAEYLSTNAIGQLYVAPRGPIGPFYVDRSAFRWTTKPSPRLLVEEEAE